MTARRLARLFAGIGLAAFFLWLLFRSISFPEIQAAFSQTNQWWVVACVAAFYGGYACRIERWRLMLLKDNADLKWKHCAGPLMASVALNNVLPLRAGDVVRAFGFNRRLGIRASTSLTTLLVERLLDLLMVASLFGLTLVCLGMKSSGLVGISGGVLAAGSLVVLIGVFVPGLFKPLALALLRIASRLLPSLTPMLHIAVNQVFSALEYTSRVHIMARLLLWSLAAWLFEGLVFWFAAMALPSVTQPLGAWLAMPVGTLATVIPSTPGFVGTFDYFVVQAMAVVDNPVTAATAYALLVHALLWLPPTIAGGVYWVTHPAQLKGPKEISS